MAQEFEDSGLRSLIIEKLYFINGYKKNVLIISDNNWIVQMITTLQIIDTSQNKTSKALVSRIRII